jgi:hypothetical protein
MQYDDEKKTQISIHWCIRPEKRPIPKYGEHIIDRKNYIHKYQHYKM